MLFEILLEIKMIFLIIKFNDIYISNINIYFLINNKILLK